MAKIIEIILHKAFLDKKKKKKEITYIVHFLNHNNNINPKQENNPTQGLINCCHTDRTYWPPHGHNKHHIYETK